MSLYPVSCVLARSVFAQAPSGLTDGGYKKRGSLAVSKIDAAGFYYLNIEGEPGHALKCILQVERAPHPPSPCRWFHAVRKTVGEVGAAVAGAWEYGG